MLIIGALVAATFGILLGAPTLRLRGDYLAIVTLGFGEIVPIVFLNSDAADQRNERDRRSLPTVPARRRHVHGIQSVALLPDDDRDRHGRDDLLLSPRWRAASGAPGRRSARTSWRPASNGINTVTTKLLAFALGASTAGIAGVFNAAKLTVVSPDQFAFVVSFTVLAMVVLGGMGNFWGVAVGAFVIYTINNVVLKTLNDFFDTVGIPILRDIDFIRPAVPALRHRARGNDAAAPGGPLPEQSTQTRAPRRGHPARRGRDDPLRSQRGGRAMSDQRNILVANKVTRRFGGLVAVNEVDFTIPEGSIVSLIGPNGAGKTTFFNVLLGIIDPTGGTVEFTRAPDDRPAAPGRPRVAGLGRPVGADRPCQPGAGGDGHPGRHRDRPRGRRRDRLPGRDAPAGDRPAALVPELPRPPRASSAVPGRTTWSRPASPGRSRTSDSSRT